MRRVDGPGIRLKGEYNAHPRRVVCDYRAYQKRTAHPEKPKAELVGPSVLIALCTGCGFEAPNPSNPPAFCPHCLGSRFERVHRINCLETPPLVA